MRLIIIITSLTVMSVGWLAGLDWLTLLGITALAVTAWAKPRRKYLPGKHQELR